MQYVYVLQSERDGIRYVGRCGVLPEVRLRQHNSNKSRFTRGHQPWKLVHVEEFPSLSAASQRERFLKSGQGRLFLDSIIPSSGIV